jgi:hypothetical protein
VWGARDFDKVMLSLPIPEYESGNTLQARLAGAAARAEEVAATISVGNMAFVKARQLIRAALVADGVAGEIDNATSLLLGVDTAIVPDPLPEN